LDQKSIFSAYFFIYTLSHPMEKYFGLRRNTEENVAINNVHTFLLPHEQLL
jgi:hypothetical protein